MSDDTNSTSRSISTRSNCSLGGVANSLVSRGLQDLANLRDTPSQILSGLIDDVREAVSEADAGLAPDELAALVVKLTRAAIESGFSKFADYATYVHGMIGDADHRLAKTAKHIEAAWRALGQCKEFSHIDPAGNVAEILKERLREQSEAIYRRFKKRVNEDPQVRLRLLMERAIKSSTSPSKSANAVFLKAESLFRMKDYEEALPAYEAALEARLSSADEHVIALLHGGQSASQLKQWDKAVRLLSQVVEQHADSPYLLEACLELGWAKQNVGKKDEAMAHYEQAAIGSQGAVGARARFMIGELYFGRKKYKDAIHQFQQVMSGYGGESAPVDVKEWQAKAGYEAARCSHLLLLGSKPADRAKLVADTKKYFQYVIEKHPRDELAPQSERVLADLVRQHGGVTAAELVTQKKTVDKPDDKSKSPKKKPPSMEDFFRQHGPVTDSTLENLPRMTSITRFEPVRSTPRKRRPSQTSDGATTPSKLSDEETKPDSSE